PDVTPSVVAAHADLGQYLFSCDGSPARRSTENETNCELLFDSPSVTPFVKDGINAAVVDGRPDAVNPAGVGTKVAAQYRLTVAPGATETVRLRLAGTGAAPSNGIVVSRSGTEAYAASAFADFDVVFAERLAEADAFF